MPHVKKTALPAVVGELSLGMFGWGNVQFGSPLPVPREGVRVDSGNQGQRVSNPSPSSSPFIQGERQRRLAFGGLCSLAGSVVAATIALWPHISCAITLSRGDILKIGKRVWQNECNGTISGLTAWNQGEDFASLGIGHFIWYPEGTARPFRRKFPQTRKLHFKARRQIANITLDEAANSHVHGTRVPSFFKRNTHGR